MLTFFTFLFQVWFQNRRMKDKRQRMAITWPYGIPPDPQIYAYLAAAAASYPYALPNPGAPAYTSLPLPGLYQSQPSSAFTPLGPQGSLKPMFEGLPSFPSSIGMPPSGLDRLPTSESTSIDSLSHRYKAESAGLAGLTGLTGSLRLVIKLGRDILPPNIFTKFDDDPLINIQVTERLRFILTNLANSRAITPKCLIGSGWLSNLAEIFCQQTFSQSLMIIQ